MNRATAALGALALAVGAAAWWFWPQHGIEHPPVAAAWSPLPSSTPAQASMAVTDAAPSAIAEVHCSHQQVSLTFDGPGREVACVGPARVTQSGSLRRHVFQPDGGGQAWSLELGVASGRVVTALLHGRAPARYRCDAGTCAGFAIGAPDPYGVRHFEINGARLSAGADAGVLVTATLRIEPQAARSCATTALDVVDGGTSSTFCADGGAGFELTDEGRYRYRFDSLEGQTISITLDSAGNVRAARFGSRNCTAGGCSGLVSEGTGAIGDEHDARSFSFAGVRLLGTDGTPATLNGRLVVPAQR